MKLLFYVFVLVGFLNFNVKSPAYFHIGYKDGYPVFREFALGTDGLFQLDDQLRLVKLKVEHFDNPRFINDCGIVAVSLKNKNKAFEMIHGKSLKEFETSTEVKVGILSPDCQYLALTDFDSTSVFKNGGLVMRLKGESHTITSQYLYYNVRLADDFVDLYRIKLDSPKSAERVLDSRTHWSGMQIFEDGEFVAFQKVDETSGGFAPALFNTKTKSLQVISESSEGGEPVYLPRKKVLYYYLNSTQGLRFSKPTSIQE